MNQDYAESTQFKKPVVFGLLLNSFFSTLAGMYLPGRYALIVSIETHFRNPCFVNDLLTISGVVDTKIKATNTIILITKIENHLNQLLVSGKMIIKVLQ